MGGNIVIGGLWIGGELVMNELDRICIIIGTTDRYNSYGLKSNEELLNGYGFSIKNNEFDIVALKLGLHKHDLYKPKLHLLKRMKLYNPRWRDNLIGYLLFSHPQPKLLAILRVFALNHSEFLFIPD